MKENIPLLSKITKISASQGAAQPDSNNVDSTESFTSYLCNKPPTVSTAKLVSFTIGFICGSTMGYTRGTFYSLFEVSGNYNHQAIFALVYFPTIFRCLIGPLADGVYSYRFGKHKTHLVLFSLVSGLALFVFSFQVDRVISEARVFELSAWLFAVQMLLVCFQSVAESFLTRVFTSELKAAAASTFDVGMGTGELISYNLFMLLNSQSFLEFFGVHRDRPAVSNQQLLWGLSFIEVCFSLYLCFFFAERILPQEVAKSSAKELVVYCKKLVSNDTYYNLLMYMILTRTFRSIAAGLIQLRLMEVGFKRASLAIVDSLTFPLTLICIYYLSIDIPFQDSLLWANSTTIICCLALLMKYLIGCFVAKSHSFALGMVLLVVALGIEKISGRYVYMNSFLFRIAPVHKASTFLGLLQTVNSFFFTVPTIVGYAAVQHRVADINTIIVWVTGLQLAILGLYHSWSKDSESKKAGLSALEVEESPRTELLPRTSSKQNI